MKVPRVSIAYKIFCLVEELLEDFKKMCCALRQKSMWAYSRSELERHLREAVTA